MKFALFRLLVASSVGFATAFGQANEFNGSKWNSCVTLYQYDNIDCTGEPIGEIQFPTWDHAGSPCYHDKTMEIDDYVYSVKDYYCTVVDGQKVFEQTVFLTVDCTGGFHHTQIFGTDSCTYGYKLKSCDATLCEKSEVPQVFNVIESNLLEEFQNLSFKY